MIRRISLFSGFLAVFFLLVVGTPFLAEADVFVRKYTKSSKSSDTENKSVVKKKSYYIRSKEPDPRGKEAGNAYYKRKTLLALNRNPPPKAQFAEGNPILLSMAGPEPRSAKELLLRAQAYRVSKAKDMLQIQRQDAHRAKVARLRSEAYVASLAEKRLKTKEAKTKPSAVKKKRVTYRKKIKRTYSQPRKIFNSNR